MFGTFKSWSQSMPFLDDVLVGRITGSSARRMGHCATFSGCNYDESIYLLYSTNAMTVVHVEPQGGVLCSMDGRHSSTNTSHISPGLTFHADHHTSISLAHEI